MQMSFKVCNDVMSINRKYVLFQGFPITLPMQINFFNFQRLQALLALPLAVISEVMNLQANAMTCEY